MRLADALALRRRLSSRTPERAGKAVREGRAGYVVRRSGRRTPGRSPFYVAIRR